MEGLRSEILAIEVKEVEGVFLMPGKQLIKDIMAWKIRTLKGSTTT